ncbi:MAG: DUF3143 domain-containing protein [Gloeomargarita sp. SKYBB_i_bin120]|nr:DUF3143 domain-containing protein [Gloeomargarita sp. SKYG98]MCS7291472.1 DUF3143 domain-containing protein [Gloeomargarita sp. SKYB120]MDW8177032.1 DUF3143 domain-containing protein [Gloeomargarita sp. SKYBB_i_bin120]
MGRWPSPDTPLYNHSLTAIEEWLRALGAQQDEQERHRWFLQQRDWQAELSLEIEELRVRYRGAAGGRDVVRHFRYSLSRQEVETGILQGP